MTDQEIEAKVIEIVAEQMGADKSKISRGTRFSTSATTSTGISPSRRPW